jgi:large subunit ribosomal protein L3
MMILSKKLGQTTFIDQKGNRVCATVLDYKNCSIIGNRTKDKDGYLANVIGFIKPKKINKPQQQEFIKKKNRAQKIC